MKLQDLQSLKLAIDTNNPDLFHGDWTTALTEVVDELILIHDAIGDASYDSAEGIEDVNELVSLYKGAMNEVAALEEDKENIMEIDFSTCKIEGVERITERIKKFENKDGEFPVKVIIKELKE